MNPNDPWDTFADVYDFAVGSFNDQDWPFYEGFISQLPPGATVLELLCGTGRITRRVLDTRRDLRVIGVDSSDRMLGVMRRRCSLEIAEGGLAIVTGSVVNGQTYADALKATVSLCVLPCSDVQLFVPQERLALFKIIFDLLSPDGLFAFDDTTRSVEELIRTTGQPTVWRGPEELNPGEVASASCVDFYSPALHRQRRTLLVDVWPSDGGLVRRVSLQADYYPLPAAETTRLLQAAGFTGIECWEDHLRSMPLNPDSCGSQSGLFSARRKSG